MSETVHCRDCKFYRESEMIPGERFCYRLKGRDGEEIGYNWSPDDSCSRGVHRDAGTVDENISFIRDRLHAVCALNQLAEECCELAHAALKLGRAIEQKNPTPVDAETAREHLRSECEDVFACLAVLGELPVMGIEERDETQKRIERWARRLQEAGCCEKH